MKKSEKISNELKNLMEWNNVTELGNDQGYQNSNGPPRIVFSLSESQMVSADHVVDLEAMSAEKPIIATSAGVFL